MFNQFLPTTIWVAYLSQICLLIFHRIRYDISLFSESCEIKGERKVLENKEGEGKSSSSSTVTIERGGLDPWTLYLYAMKSPATALFT